MSIHKRITKKGPRYDVRLRDPNGNGYSRSFTTAKEAAAYQADELSAQGRGVWVDPRRSETSFSEWAAHWQASNPSKRPKTLETEENILRLHVLPVLGTRPLATITPVDIQNLVLAWAKDAAPNSVRRRYALTKAIFAAAVEAELLGRSPCKRSIRLPKVEAKDKRVMTPQEVAAMAVAVGPDYGPLVLLGAVTGHRIGELAGLQVRDVDFFRLTVTVRRNVNEVKGVVVIGEPKTDAGRRTMAIPAAMRDVLTEHLRRHDLTAADGDAWLFPSPDGGPLRKSTFYARVWNPARKRLGLLDVTTRSLRYTNTTSLVGHTDVKTAQHRLGHTDPALTLRVYAQRTRPGDEAAAAAVGAELLPNDETLCAMNVRWNARRDPKQAPDLEPGVGIEPTTSSLQERCSAD